MEPRSGQVSVLYADGLTETVRHPATDLEATGEYAVRLARTVEEALEALAADSVDCLVTSTELADGSVRDLLTSVREDEPELPVLVVGPDVDELGDRLAEPGVRAIELDSSAGDSRSQSVDRVLAAQIDRLVDRPAGSGRPLAAIPDPAFVYDEGFVDWNDAFASLLESDHGRLAERSISDVFQCTPAELAAAAEDGTALTVGGAESWQPDRSFSVSVGRDGDEYLCLVDETTAEERSLAADRSPAAMLDSLLAGIPLAIFFKDRQSRHVAVSNFQVGEGHEWAIQNPEGKVHHATADVIGKTDFDLYPAERAEEAVEHDRKVMETEEVHVDESAVVTVQEMEEVSTTAVKDLVMTTIKAPWYDENGDVVGVVGVTPDVTEKAEYERRAAAGDAILETIDRMLETQVRPALAGAPASSGVERDDSSLERLDGVIADIETLLRSHNQPESTELVDLGEAVRGVWAEVTRDRRRLSVETTSCVDASPVQLRVLLTELLENAVVHTGPDTEIVLGELDDGFYLEDDGPSIEPASRTGVFEYGTTESADRIGGGLAIVDAIATSHGWSTTITEGARDGVRVVVSDLTLY